MKRLTQISKAIILFSLSFFLFASPVQAQEESPQLISSIDEESSIQPRSDIIEWMYKVVDGKLYRRQYNFTRGCWIGEWEYCP